MQFCPECGMRIVKFVKKDGEDFGICVYGHETRLNHPRIDEKERNDKKGNHESAIVIIDAETKLKEKATITSIACPYCGVRKCKLLTSFMFAGDEENVNIMRCLNCGKNFRVGIGLPGH